MGGNESTHNEANPAEDLEENAEQVKIPENESDDDGEKTESVIPEKEENDKEEL